MRTLHATINTAIGQKITKPIYLVELTTSAVNYFSTREQIAWDSGGGSHNYISGRIVSLKVKAQSCSIELENADRAISAAAMQGTLAGNSIKVFLYYNGQGFLRFEGEVDSFTINEDGGSTVEMDCTSVSMLQTKWPVERITFGLGFGFLPRSGKTFIYGNQHHTIEVQR